MGEISERFRKIAKLDMSKKTNFYTVLNEQNALFFIFLFTFRHFTYSNVSMKSSRHKDGHGDRTEINLYVF